MTGIKGNGLLAYERIRQQIIEGNYLPGSRLVEQRLGVELGLSRTPVREALRRLEAEGLVRSEPNRGAVVRSVTYGEVRDIYGLRAQLESYGAGLAAENATREDLERIDGGIELFGSLIHQLSGESLDSVRAVHDANEEIHAAIVASAHHQRLGYLLARTVDVPLVFQSFRHFDLARSRRSHLFHQMIRDAIAAGDPIRAANLMTEHIMQGRDVLLAQLQKNEGAAPKFFDTGN
ncbi:GntR family transcriptional regulator [Actinomadura sp. 7K507]|uniref:GntR family transcriptional regulator n=1 Tax=Actinomadura sp. 7K507 TaxID=2530365 RepID=UPI0010472B5B|nr:GntR family transcriptional regulator [Actinomadura sp. 7K507]TDC85698.1 GntR family transcriptional regulator [Actinomadura sp. 7K507]